MKFIINPKGLTLVELLLSMAISSIILLAIMQNFTLNQNSTKQIASIYELISIKQNIHKILANPNSCKATLAGYSVNSTAYGVTAAEITQITSKEDSTSSNINLYASNTNTALATAYGNKLIKIRGFRLDSTQTGLGEVAKNSIGYTDLVIEFFLVGNSEIKERRVRLEATTNSSGQIINCSVDGVWSVNNKEMARTFCEKSLGGSFSNSGRGGIGQCFNLSIDGSITALNVPLSTGGAVGVQEFEEIAEYICLTLGGSFFALATGTAGVGECKNLKPHGDFIINSSSTASKLILDGGDIFMF